MEPRNSPKVQKQHHHPLTESSARPECDWIFVIVSFYCIALGRYKLADRFPLETGGEGNVAIDSTCPDTKAGWDLLLAKS